MDPPVQKRIIQAGRGLIPDFVKDTKASTIAYIELLQINVSIFFRQRLLYYMPSMVTSVIMFYHLCHFRMACNDCYVSPHVACGTHSEQSAP